MKLSCPTNFAHDAHTMQSRLFASSCLKNAGESVNTTSPLRICFVAYMPRFVNGDTKIEMEGK